MPLSVVMYQERSVRSILDKFSDRHNFFLFPPKHSSPRRGSYNKIKTVPSYSTVTRGEPLLGAATLLTIVSLCFYSEDYWHYCNFVWVYCCECQLLCTVCSLTPPLCGPYCFSKGQHFLLFHNLFRFGRHPR